MSLPRCSGGMVGEQAGHCSPAQLLNQPCTHFCAGAQTCAQRSLKRLRQQPTSQVGGPLLSCGCRVGAQCKHFWGSVSVGRDKLLLSCSPPVLLLPPPLCVQRS